MILEAIIVIGIAAAIIFVDDMRTWKKRVEHIEMWMNEKKKEDQATRKGYTL